MNGTIIIAFYPPGDVVAGDGIYGPDSPFIINQCAYTAFYDPEGIYSGGEPLFTFGPYGGYIQQQEIPEGYWYLKKENPNDSNDSKAQINTFLNLGFRWNLENICSIMADRI